MEAVGALKLRRDIAELVTLRTIELIASGEIANYPSPSYLFRALLEEGISINAVQVERDEIAEIDYPIDLDVARGLFREGGS